MSLVFLTGGLFLSLPTAMAGAAPPPNDDFSNASPLQEGQLDASASNVEATKEAGEPDHRGDPVGASIWFKWTAPRSGGAFLQACAEGDKFLVAAYTGNAVNALAAAPPIESWGNCQYEFFATAGTTYYIAIDGQYDPIAGAPATGDPGVSLLMVPTNDDFEKARDLGSSTDFGLFGPSSIGATKQLGEPYHAGNQGGASVWFTWTAPFTGSVQLSACSTTFHTLLVAYRGSSLTSLTQVASSDNAQSSPCLSLGGGQPGELAFNIDVGTVYRIAVDGYEGESGKFDLDMKASTERLKSPTAASTPVFPDTRIIRRHVRRRRGFASFRLASSEEDLLFQCSLDGVPFGPCDKVVRIKELKSGRHQFQARTVNASGAVDPTPATFSFKVRRRKP